MSKARGNSDDDDDDCNQTNRLSDKHRLTPCPRLTLLRCNAKAFQQWQGRLRLLCPASGVYSWYVGASAYRSFMASLSLSGRPFLPENVVNSQRNWHIGCYLEFVVATRNMHTISVWMSGATRTIPLRWRHFDTVHAATTGCNFWRASPAGTPANSKRRWRTCNVYRIL